LVGIAINVLFQLLVLLLLFGGAAWIESQFPADPKKISTRFNLAHAAFITVLHALLEPIAGIETAQIMGTATGAHALFHLPSGPWTSIGSAVVLLIAKDLIDFAVHRAQHKFPVLWAMHSFHHSDEAMNVTTSQRHFWLERIVYVLVLYLPIGILFSFSEKTSVMFIVGATFFSLFPHMNLRCEFGRFSWILLGPQLHRMHHSSQPEDFDANFAGMFPIWDVVFGSYRAPKRGYFPATGIGERVQNSPIEALVWPLRHSVARPDHSTKTSETGVQES
jgi:sterol desaturase/sphingolipid hydroxylase (fatty acid hydroxylase superfamily)